MTSIPEQPSSERPPRPQRVERPWRVTERPVGPTNPDPATPPEEVYFSIGKIVGAHGVRGEAKMEIHSQHPERIPALRRVYFDDDLSTPHRLISARLHGGQALLTLEGVTDRDAADALRGTVVRISGAQARPLDEGAFYHYQLLGLAVFTEDGTPLGELADIIESGGVDIYVVRAQSGAEQLFPALHDVVLEIDPPANRMVVRPQVWEPEVRAVRKERRPRSTRPRTPDQKREAPPS